MGWAGWVGWAGWDGRAWAVGGLGWAGLGWVGWVGRAWAGLGLALLALPSSVKTRATDQALNTAIIQTLTPY